MKRPAVLGFALMLAAVGCATRAPAPKDATDTLKVGVVMSQTGDAAVYGRSALAGIEYGIEHVNESGDLGNTHLELIARDDHSTVEGARRAFHELIDEEKVSVIVGPMLSVVAAETDGIAQQAGIPVLAATNSALDTSKFGDTVWRISLGEPEIIDAGVQAAAEKSQVTTAALAFDPEERYSSAAAEWFRESAKRYGIRILRESHFTTGGRDHDAALAGAAAPGPEALFIPAYAGDALAFLRGMEALNLPQLVVGGNGFNTPSVLRAAGRTRGGMIVAASWDPGRTNPLSREFVAGYRQATGRDPDTFSAQGYASIEILTWAVVLGGRGSGAVTEGLRSFKAHETVLGTVSFSDEREAEYPPFVRYVRFGKSELLP